MSETCFWNHDVRIGACFPFFREGHPFCGNLGNHANPTKGNLHIPQIALYGVGKPVIYAIED